MSFACSIFHEVHAQCFRLITLVARVTVLDIHTEDFDANDTILLPHLELLELHLHGPGMRALHSLIVPALSVLSFVTPNWGADDPNLSTIADMLHYSSSPLIDLHINDAVEEDIGCILKCYPRLLYLDLPLCYFVLQTIKKMTCGGFVPNIQAFRCRIYHDVVDVFLDMLETMGE